VAVDVLTSTLFWRRTYLVGKKITCQK